MPVDTRAYERATIKKAAKDRLARKCPLLKEINDMLDKEMPFLDLREAVEMIRFTASRSDYGAPTAEMIDKILELK